MLYIRRASSWASRCLHSRTFSQVAVRQISNVPKHKIVHSKDNPFVTVSEEIRAAIEEGKPVVALESAIYTHGTYIQCSRHWKTIIKLS